MNNRTEQLILLKLQSGDPEAYSDLYNEFAKPIYRFIYFRVGRDQGIAEDMMQDVFLHFIEVTDKEHITQVKAYLYRIARNLVIDFYREQSRMVKLDLDSVQELISQLGKSAIESRVELEILTQAIYKLKESWRDLILMRYSEGLDYETIARIVGRSENYVRVNTHRAKKELHKLFNQTND